LSGLVELFREQHRRGLFPGGQLAVSRGGELVVEESVGIGRGFRAEEGVPPQPVTGETRFQTMSVSKALVGFAAAILEDRGLVDVAAPVARYFPEFGANGKGDITVHDVLTHRSGVLAEELVRDPARWTDGQAVTDAIAAAKPERRRGTLCYESHAFGWITAEVVRRVTGRPLPDFLREVAGEELGRMAFLATSGDPPSARTYWLGGPTYRLGGVNLPDGFEQTNNDVACARAVVPGAGLLATARDLVRFYELLLAGGVGRSGRRIVREETLRRYVTRQTAGIDAATHAYVVLGRGFALGWTLPHLYGWWGSSACFGHAGGFSCLAFADPRARLAIAILTNGNRSLVDMLRRFAPLSSRARAGKY
jgi:CubicO group peptidase (beta-lactamase class C family)